MACTSTPARPQPDVGPQIDAGVAEAGVPDLGPPDLGWRTEPFDAGPVDALPQRTLLGQWVEVPAGKFLRGSEEREFGHTFEELRKEVTLTRGFLMKVTEVTQAEWLEVMGGDNPSYFADCGTNCPVENITWFQAVEFTNKLSQREGLAECYSVQGEEVTFAGLDCSGYRLPTEAEWEYACRSGTNLAPYCNGKYAYDDYGPCPNAPEADEVGWYCDNSRQEAAPYSHSHPVGLKPANAWGLMDMHGNAAEWMHGWYQRGYYHFTESLVDPPGSSKPDGRNARTLRGGSHGTGPVALRCAHRTYGVPSGKHNSVGFRPVRTLINQ